LLVLSWATDGDARIRRLDARTETFLTRIRLIGARFAYAITWLDSEQVAVRIPGRRDAPAFAIAPGEQQPLRSPLGEIYPLGADAVEASFVHGFDDPPHYPTTQDSQPLHRLSVANLARHGTAASFATGQMHLVDSDSQQTVWHRLNAEAALPVGTAFIAWLAATSEPEPPTDSSAWCAHHFGRRGTAPIGPHEPHAAWEPMASELPGHPGLGPWERETDRAGLFSVLIQDAHHRVRALTGRYLWLRLELFGDGRASPQIAAVRAWGSRFSYRDTYLPRIYRESLYGAPAIAPGIRFAELPVGDLLAQLDAGGTAATTLLNAFSANGVVLGGVTHIRVEQAGVQWLLADRASGRSLRVRREDQALALYRPQATPADFLERFLCSFEAMLTPLEDKVAAAHLLSDPASAPEAHLDWLGAWIGVAFDSALPAERRRQWLAAAPQLARYHGTTRGLALALDIATGGGVRGGEIVLLEDFRLRRVFATLLGVDLTDEHDPLLPGLTISGNSIVGDTLILGEAETVELLALFRSEVATPEENAAVLSFYDKLAHRATVLVHQTVSPQDLGLIRRIVELESPAHVEVRVLTATWPLLVGVASLVGVDTYLGPPLLPQPARVEVSSLGLGDYVLGDAALDPRVNGAAAAPLQSRPPVANAGEDLTVPFGRSFDLDGSSSSAAPERSIERFTWRRTE
jgi:phage tail-like protein